MRLFLHPVAVLYSGFFMRKRGESIENADFSGLTREFENYFLELKSYRDTFSAYQLIFEWQFLNRKIIIFEARGSLLHEISGLLREDFKGM